MTENTGLLLAALFIGHYLGDFTGLSTARMLDAKAEGGPLHILAAHSLVHGLLAGVAAALFVWPDLQSIGVATATVFSTHFVIDTVRSRLGVRFPGLVDPSRKEFWSVLGLDQLAHGLVLIVVAAMVQAA